ncbi:MAG: hypothetical protein AB7I33_17520, partial [Gemmatimonadales bacterium]
ISSVSPDGDQIVFASDRTAGGLGGAINLFLLDLQTHQIRQLTVGPWQDLTPRWARDGRIYFTSSRDGVLNVFSLDSLGTGRRETSAWTGAFDPAYIPDRKALLVSGFSNLNWGIYLYPRDSAAQSDTFGLAEGAPHSEWRWPVADSAQAAIAKRQPYQRKLTLDFAAGEAAVIPGYGGLQGAQAFLSDLLGDHFVYLGIASYQGRNLGNILENLNATAIYLNQSRRLNWGVGAYRTNLASYSGPFDISYREKAYGALGLIRYPLDRYNRIEAETVLEHSDRVDFEFPDGAPVPADGLRRVGWINSNYLSYITDNSLWLYSGPIDGRRFRLTLGAGSDLSHARFDNYLVNVDARRYFRLANRVAYAVRLFGWYSGGALPRRVNLGGSLAMRGYPLYGTIVGSRAYMVNQELRFPLLNYLTLGTPAGPLTLPELQGAAFVDVGKAWYLDQSSRALIGSYGISFRWALAPFLVLRLDWGRRFSDDGFRGYPLTPDEKRPGFVKFFFGYNY